MRAALAFLLLVSAGPSVEAAAPALSEPARWLQGYLRLDTSNPPGDEHRAAAYLGRILRAEGIATQLYVSPRGRTNLVARLAAPAGQGTVVLLHHMDTVAAGPSWTAAPFGGEVRDGRLYGRGAVDAKGLGIAHLAAMVDLRRRGVVLRRDLLFVAVADEETGGGEGTAWLLAHHPELFEGVDLVLNEGGPNRVVGGRTLWWGIETAQKRPLWLELQASGRPGHASGVRPHSAAHTLVSALARLLAEPPRYRVSPPARAYLAALAPLHNAHWRPIFARIDDHLRSDGPTHGLLPGMANLFLDTVQVTVLEAGEAINVIPERARARVDVRLLPDTDAAAFLARAREHLGQEIEVRTLLASPPAAPSPSAGALYDTLARGLGGGSAPVVAAMIAGFTDSRFFRERGIPAYGVSPFALDGESLGGIHGPDERLPLAVFDEGVERMRRVVEAIVTR